MRIVVSEFITLDGVIEAPDQWSFPYGTDELYQYKLDELMTTDAGLLGRVTYEGFAAAWPESDESDFATRLNNMPKYVVSTTLEKAEWNNSHIIRSNVPEEIARLKQQPGNDMAVSGSATLIQTLIRHDLVDEYHLLVYPVVLGKGIRLFQEGATTNLKLVESRTFSSGVVLLVYQRERTA
jgi:dihydrofolate reductase